MEKPLRKRLDPISALNALDLALESQKAQAEMDGLLLALAPLLEEIERLRHEVRVSAGEGQTRERERVYLLAEAAENFRAKIGLERIGEINERCDAGRHQIVDTVCGDEREPGTVLQVIECGWSFRGRILRPAKVLASAKSTRIREERM